MSYWLLPEVGARLPAEMYWVLLFPPRRRQYWVFAPLPLPPGGQDCAAESLAGGAAWPGWRPLCWRRLLAIRARPPAAAAAAATPGQTLDPGPGRTPGQTP